MARPQKYNLDYFPFDCGFFNDDKIKRLRRRFGAVGILTYINLLSRIYSSSKGYYLKFDNLEDLAFDIAEDIANNQIDKTARQVNECIRYCASSSIFCEDNFKRGVITARNIQTQYQLSTAQFRRKAVIQEYALIQESDYSEYPIPKTEINAEETGVNVAKTQVNATFSTQKEREKEIKNYNKKGFYSSSPKTQHFASEREYSKEELDALIDSVDDIKF